MKIGFIMFTLVLFGFQCKEKTNPADIPPAISSIPNIKGEWILEWENGIHQIQLNPEDKKILWDGNEGLELDLDSLGIRIRAYDEETVKGYFLYSDIKPKSWIGTWENRVVRLIRRN
ncbi:hypothetical protein EHQ43_18110 [Leptospira bouyouniensis]|uniref:Lipocalin-like domain-containing protein n=1 Tax=Leptospira bouyouniensis TaxID=2484911 RepID=A0A7I0HMJ0_9LEPT|nr:hypothetical protein EHQ10_13110 [Leptospira bouyouniensis]TGL02354.1 hypothetical protein EHQ43_18110 [Leptospira bouyouniensis]TGM81226.1 hypothetical protein EHQ99_15375 [Leptospira bouyouniensis]